MHDATRSRQARAALREHAEVCAAAARARHAPIDRAALDRILADRAAVRYPVELRFGAGALEPGEFAWAEPCGSHPRDGFTLWIHPHFRDREQDLPFLVAYHVVSINYGDVATCEEAEAFGAALLGLDRDAYYARVCQLADELGVTGQGA